MPTLHITPIITTSSDKNVVLIERNIINKINAESAREPIVNHFISCAILSATCVRIKGSPLMCAGIFVLKVKVSVAFIMSLITFVRPEEFSISLLILTIIIYALVAGLYRSDL